MKAIVVGAGFAGLAAADELQRAGVEVAVYEARNRVGGRVHSFPFAGAVAERGAEFILPGNGVVLATAERLGLPLVRKGTLYGDREPKGDGSVTGADVARAIAEIASRPPPNGARTLADALGSYGLAAGVAEAIQARIEVSCAYPAEDLAASVLEEGAAAFGQFDTYTVHVAVGDAAVLAVPAAALSASRSIRPFQLTWAEDPWTRGAYSAASASAPLDTETLSGLVGPLAFAGEHTAGDWHGLMEGALRSGARAARQVLQNSTR